jgi:hypothetical protein
MLQHSVLFYIFKLPEVQREPYITFFLVCDALSAKHKADI